jgi:hypothetical protein
MGRCSRGRAELRVPNAAGGNVKAGERNPDILCEESIEGHSPAQQWATSEAARSSVLGKQKLGRNTGQPEALPRRPPFTLQLRHGGRNPATTLAQWRGFPWRERVRLATTRRASRRSPHHPTKLIVLPTSRIDKRTQGDRRHCLCEVLSLTKGLGTGRRHHAAKAHWLDYDPVALAVLVIGMGMIHCSHCLCDRS